MLGVEFCWRSFRSMALSIPKAAETGGRIVGSERYRSETLFVCVSRSQQQTEEGEHRCVSLLPGRYHVSNTQVRWGRILT